MICGTNFQSCQTIRNIETTINLKDIKKIVSIELLWELLAIKTVSLIDI